MPSAETLKKTLDVCEHIAKKEDEFITTLAEVVAIKSVSTWIDHRPEVERMANWFAERIRSLDGTAEVRQLLSKQQLPDGTTINYAPAVLGWIGKDPSKKTLLVYGHYDVQPADVSDGWETDPWKLERMPNDELRGRGSTDDKGPLLGWLNVVQAYQSLGTPLPVNLRFILEGMEESGSPGFDELVYDMHRKKDPLFQNVDFCCISDNYWLTEKKPCVTHGLRGIVSVSVEIAGPSMDLHSGIYGGQTYEVMDDLLAILSSLKDSSGNITIPGILDQVAALTPNEEKNYETIEFDMQQRKDSIGVSKIRFEDNVARCLQSVWRNPSLTIHGIEGAFSAPGFKTVIPKRVVGKFSIRCVPNMNMADTVKLIEDWVRRKFAELKSPNKLSIATENGRWWHASPDSPVFLAAIKAIEKVFGVKPDITREGGSIPTTLTLSEVTGKDLCLLPMGRSNDRAHSQNEKLDVSNYIKGMQTYAHFLHELSILG